MVGRRNKNVKRRKERKWGSKKKRKGDKERKRGVRKGREEEER